MILSLIAQATYQDIQCSIFKNETCLATIAIPKQLASKNLVSMLLQLLNQHTISFSELKFIGANLGPAPFTTLRVLIATLNGIGFAKQIPLVGVDGLKAFMYEVSSPKWPQTVILLNAYQHDVYFAYQEKTGYTSIELLLTRLTSEMPHGIVRFVGDGARQHASTLTQTLGERAYIDQNAPAFVSLNAIAHDALQYWHNHETCHQLFPLYLKTSFTKN